MNNYFKNVIILSFFILLTFVFTWPLILTIQNGFISPVNGGDAPLNIWDIYLFKFSLQNHISPFYTDTLFFPEGANLIMHGYMPAMCLFSMFFKNNILAMNIYLILHFILSAFGAYLLSFKLTKQTLISIIVGIAFAFSAYKMLRLTEHYMLVLTASVPFYIICFLNAFTFTEGIFFPKILSIKNVIFCLLLGIFTALNDYYTTIYLLYFSLGWACFYKFIFYWKKWSWKKKLIILLTSFIGMHLIVEPLHAYGFDDRGGSWWGGDLLAYFIPDSNSWLWNRDIFRNIFPALFTHEPNMEFQLFIGYSMIILTIYLIYYCIKYPLPTELSAWIFVLILFFLITLPSIKVNGIRIIYAPTAILHFIPFFNNLRCNTRILELITLVLPLSTAIMLSNFLQNKTSVLIKYVLPIIFIGLTIMDLKPTPYTIMDTKSIPAIYDDVKESNGTVLTPIPTGVADGLRHDGKFMSLYQFYQTFHQKKLSGGYISRVPESTFEYYEKDSVMHTILSLSKNMNTPFKIPSISEKENYYRNFKTDMFLIEPSYRNSNAETYIDELIKNKKHYSILKNNYRLIILQ